MEIPQAIRELRYLSKAKATEGIEIDQFIAKEITDYIDHLEALSHGHPGETLPKDGKTYLTFDQLSGFQLTYWGQFLNPCRDGDDLDTGWTDGCFPTVWDGKHPDRWWNLPTCAENAPVAQPPEGVSDD